MSTYLDLAHIHALLLSGFRLFIWLLLLSVVFMPLERLFTLHPRKILTKRFASDIGFYFISGLIPGLLLTPLLVLVAVAANALVPASVHVAVAALPLWARAVAALVVSEVGFYWGHRWSHEIPLLWRFHSIHHDPTEIYYLVSSRAHPIDMVFTRLCGLIPVYLLGIATPLTPEGGVISALLVLVITMWGLFIHANMRWRLGPLEWLVATPAFHHWHHTLAEPRDRNFASTLPIMDRIFGTHYLPRDKWPTSYGIDNKLPASMGSQLLHPFRTPPRQAPMPDAAVTDP